LHGTRIKVQKKKKIKSFPVAAVLWLDLFVQFVHFINLAESPRRPYRKRERAKLFPTVATCQTSVMPIAQSLGQEGQESQEKRPMTNGNAAEDDDDLQLLKLGYRSELARAWGAFDNFACSFSALYCIGGIRVLFYIALSAGGPAAMYVTHLSSFHEFN
jgi:hypothetical protein